MCGGGGGGGGGGEGWMWVGWGQQRLLLPPANLAAGVKSDDRTARQRFPCLLFSRRCLPPTAVAGDYYSNPSLYNVYPSFINLYLNYHDRTSRVYKSGI